MRRFAAWLSSPTGFRSSLLVILVLDLAVTATVWFVVPSAHYGQLAEGRVVFGVFVVFPLVLIFAVSIPISVVLSIRDWRQQRTGESRTVSGENRGRDGSSLS